MLGLSLLAATFATVPSPADQILGRMVALYDEVCLKAFPDDAAVDKVMAQKKAKALTPDQVSVTFNNDPGRGWLIEDGDRTIQVMLELPPYHACSVRRTIPELPDGIKAYRDLADRYQASRPGFAPIAALGQDMKQVHIHGVGEQRNVEQGTEAMFLIDQQVTDPERRSKGETAVDFRMVHQFGAPGAQ